MVPNSCLPMEVLNSFSMEQVNPNGSFNNALNLGASVASNNRPKSKLRKLKSGVSDK